MKIKETNTGPQSFSNTLGPECLSHIPALPCISSLAPEPALITPKVARPDCLPAFSQAHPRRCSAPGELGLDMRARVIAVVAAQVVSEHHLSTGHGLSCSGKW